MDKPTYEELEAQLLKEQSNMMTMMHYLKQFAENAQASRLDINMGQLRFRLENIERASKVLIKAFSEPEKA